MSKQKFEFGTPVRDRITGFKGVYIAFSSYMTGCNQGLVSPPVKDGDWKDSHWFDEGRLEEIEGEKIKIEDVKNENDGCDIPAPVK